jgi:hypothetical protein
MLHKPLKPRTMLTAEPAIKAPWVALIAWTNLYKKHADSVRTCVIADKRRKTNNAKHWRRHYCRCDYLMRFTDVHDAWRIDDGQDHREKVEGVSHYGGQS